MKNSIFALAMLLTGTLSFASTGETKDVKEPIKTNTTISKSEGDGDNNSFHCIDGEGGRVYCCESKTQKRARECANRMRKAVEGDCDCR